MLKNEKLYVSGGMSHLPDFNFPMFDDASAALRHLGATVFSPAENDRLVLRKQGITRLHDIDGFAEGDVSSYEQAIGNTKDLFRWDFNTLTNECTGIVMLPKWQASTGARWERTVAEALGLTVYLAVRSGAGWNFVVDADQKRLSTHLAEFASKYGVQS